MKGIERQAACGETSWCSPESPLMMAVPEPDLAGPSLRPELGFGLDAFLSLLLADLAVLQIVPFDRALRRLVPLRQPVAERIAEPRRLRAQLRQPELLPDFLCALHVFLLRQREGRHVAFHGRVDQKRRVLRSEE